jgi:Zn-dependent peptidase ImmA (M78 family)
MPGTGEMLRLARQRKGFSQKEAAKRTWIAQPLLSRYENGVADPDETFLSKAALVYEVPRQFFDIREPVYGPPVSVHPMPRAKADVTTRDLDIVTAELNIRVMQMRRFLEAVDFQPTASVPSLNIEQYGSPERVAAVLRAHWMLPSGPVKNLTRLAEAAGIVVGTSDFAGASISGMTFRVPGQPPLVLLNAFHPADRMRLTLAHELGHLVMHRFPTPSMEEEAYSFGAALLMPPEEMRNVFNGRRITLDLLAALKPEWRVSMQALLMCAKKLGYLDYNQSRYLWQQLSAKGWRLREPPELDFEHEHPSVLRTIIKAHFKMGFSLSDMCNLVPLHESDFLQMYGPIDDDSPPRPRLRLVI